MIHIVTLGSHRFDLTGTQAIWLANHWANRLTVEDRARLLVRCGLRTEAEPIINEADASRFFETMHTTHPLLAPDIARTAQGLAEGSFPERSLPAAPFYVPKSPPPALTETTRQRIGQENLRRLRTWFGVDVTGSTGLGGTIRIALPPLFANQAEAGRWMRGAFPGAAFSLTAEKTADGRFTATLSLRAVLRQLDAAHHPFGARYLSSMPDDARLALLEECAFMLNASIPGADPFAESEETLTPQQLKQRKEGHRTLNMEKLMRAGAMHLDVRDETSIVWKAAQHAQRSGLIGPDDLAIASGRKHTHFDITLSRLGFLTLSELLLKGFPDPAAAPGTEAPVLSLMSQDATEARTARLSAQRVREGLAALREKPTLATTDSIPALNAAAMLAALQAVAPLVEDEHNWKGLAAAEPYAKVNPIRDRLRATVRDMRSVLATPDLTPQELLRITRDSMWADSIHTLGHMADIVYASGGKKQDARVENYLNAFSLTRLGLQPKDEASRDAAYYTRKTLGQISAFDQARHFGLVGIRSLWDSVRFATTKPLQVGGTLVAIFAASTLLPRGYRPYNLISAAVEKTMNIAGVDHERKEALLEGMRDMAKGIGSNKGYLAVAALTGGTLCAAFLVFSVVEDFVLHAPLALASMGVGFTGGAIGVNVFRPFLNEIANIAGSLLPRSVQRSLASDWQKAKTINAETSLKGVAASLKEGYADLNDLGALATLSDPSPRFAERLAIMRDQALRSGGQLSATPR